MRGSDDINPSHARNERALNDEKMHQMLVEKNIERYIQSIANSSMTLSAERSIAHYTW